jgi:1-acyl-sn-glycerol-3-phosphate acyltransferase
MNFAEGTRFTAEKHTAQHSTYKHLLKPKSGALALALNAMGNKFQSLVDATIVYPDGVPTFWDFLCGRTPRIVLHVQQVPIPEGFAEGDYEGDPRFRSTFHRWLATLWKQKDQRITQIYETM